MASEILSVGTGAAHSLDVDVADGEKLTVCLKDADGGTLAERTYLDIELKDDAGHYVRVARLSAREPALVISAVGTYRFSRPGNVTCGVFSG